MQRAKHGSWPSSHTVSVSSRMWFRLWLYQENSCAQRRTSAPRNELMTDSIEPVITNGWLRPNLSAPTQQIRCGLFMTRRRKDAEPRLETYPYHHSGFGSLALWWSSLVLPFWGHLRRQAEQWEREIWRFYIRWVCCAAKFFSLTTNTNHDGAEFYRLCHVGHLHCVTAHDVLQSEWSEPAGYC